MDAPEFIRSSPAMLLCRIHKSPRFALLLDVAHEELWLGSHLHQSFDRGTLCLTPDAGTHLVKQGFRAQVRDHVQIGANSVVDRGSWRDTVIDEHAKLDSLVHIGKPLWQCKPNRMPFPCRIRKTVIRHPCYFLDSTQYQLAFQSTDMIAGKGILTCFGNFFVVCKVR